MRKQAVQSAARDVATQLRSLEESIDHTLEQLAYLQTSMLNARSTARVGPHIGQEALAEVAQALGSIVAGRGQIASAHALLKGTSQQVPGLREMNYGDVAETPPPSGMDTLRVVA
ncbi:hypothetical protein WJS89_05470 [Sphingomicrobium sp. XHP0235]|uniref:hypothetical protein n=1 Tax=Sphingomicrobium aquimarinum TaxID=3133971 RepID=UPI0031FE7F2A